MLPSIGPSPWQHRNNEAGNRAFFPQMIRCATQIGMDPHQDAEFLWIAEKARDAVYDGHLPAPWKKLQRKKGATVDAYYNPITQELTADHPALPFFRRLFAESREEREMVVLKTTGQRKMTMVEKGELAMQKRQRKRERHLNRAALRVQRIWRGNQARAGGTAIHVNREHAVSLLQAGFRGLKVCTPTPV